MVGDHMNNKNFAAGFKSTSAPEVVCVGEGPAAVNQGVPMRRGSVRSWFESGAPCELTPSAAPLYTSGKGLLGVTLHREMPQ